MSKGIVLIALGHPNYGKMAAALAATIRAASPDCAITLFHDQSSISHLRAEELNLFERTELQQSVYMLNGQARFLRPKLQLYALSPYDETIYLDVDMAWLGEPITHLFQECQNHDFLMKNYGNEPIENTPNDGKAWYNYGDANTVYKLDGTLKYNLSSECIYFKKTKEVKKLFAEALKVFDKPKINYRPFAGYVADEMAFAIGMMVTQFYPAIDNWQPIFWRQTNKAICTVQNLKQNFHAISMGGTRCTDQEQSIYNVFVSSAYFKLGISYPYKWVNKYRFLTERKII